MTNQPMNMDVFDRYLDIMNRLWNLNQSMIRTNMQYTLWENEQLKKTLVPDNVQSDDDLPF